MSILTTTLRKYDGEVRAYLFDFTDFPEVAAGETLSGPVVPAVAGLTVGVPEVTDAAYDGIAAGKAVKVTLSGGTAEGTYTVACSVSTSGGATLTVRGRLAVD